MMIVTFFFSLLLSLSAFSMGCDSKGPNVILFTWDGVRSYEFFKGTGPFHKAQLPPSERGQILKKFWSKYADQGMVLGEGRGYKIASDVAVSLPSYQALMAGHSTHCKNNGCESIKVPSILERVKNSLDLPRKDVAAFASWNRLIAAVAQDPTQITHGIYPEIFSDGLADAQMIAIQQRAMQDLPLWQGSRKDKYTFELGMQYLKKHCPRLLYLSLVDSDEFGHHKDYPGYVRSLRTYDEYLHQLIETLDQMGDYGKQTTLMVTTDHSRGAGPFWVGHAITQSSEKHVFFYARGRGVKPIGVSSERGGHENIRPTIEYLLGLEPSGPILPHINLQ